MKRSSLSTHTLLWVFLCKKITFSKLIWVHNIISLALTMCSITITVYILDLVWNPHNLTECIIQRYTNVSCGNTIPTWPYAPNSVAATIPYNVNTSLTAWILIMWTTSVLASPSSSAVVLRHHFSGNQHLWPEPTQLLPFKLSWMIIGYTLHMKSVHVKHWKLVFAVFLCAVEDVWS